MNENIHLAKTVYSDFRRKPESQHIASEFALVELAKLVARIRPQNVLEIGAGIGTITALLAAHSDRPKLITATEDNEICIEHFGRNIKAHPGTVVELVRKISDVDFEQHYDLIVFDGSLDGSYLTRLIRGGAVCFIEGYRGSQLKAVSETAEALGLQVKWQSFRPMRIVLRGLRKTELFGLPLSVPRLVPFRRKKGCSIGTVHS